VEVRQEVVALMELDVEVEVVVEVVEEEQFFINCFCLLMSKKGGTCC
jgi:hypothetical protein